MKKQMCTFMLDDFQMGIDVNKVQEILRGQEITHVPLAPKTVSGLLNLRGQIVMVVDLKNKFGLSNKSLQHSALVIIKGDEGPACYQVDKIGEVIEVDDATLEALPPQLAPEILQCGIGVYSGEHGLVLELSSEKLGES